MGIVATGCRECTDEPLRYNLGPECHVHARCLFAGTQIQKWKQPLLHKVYADIVDVANSDLLHARYFPEHILTAHRDGDG